MSANIRALTITGAVFMKKILNVALMMLGVALVAVTLWPREQQKRSD